jgi:hypothetical protein
MAYSADAFGEGRDERLDLLRGLCLLKMVLSHLWPQPVDLQPLFGFVSAAEGFFLISGATTGIVFGRRAESGGFAFASRGLARRGVQLYLLNLVLVFVLFAAETTRILQFSQFRHPGFSVFELFDFNQPYFLQVLPRYALFLLLAPLALGCLRSGRTAWLVAVSLGLWILVLSSGRRLAVPYLEHGPHGGFLLLSWQLLFFGGMALGHHRDRVGRLARASAVLTIVLPAVCSACGCGVGPHGGQAGWRRRRSRCSSTQSTSHQRLLDLSASRFFFSSSIASLCRSGAAAGSCCRWTQRALPSSRPHRDLRLLSLTVAAVRPSGHPRLALAGAPLPSCGRWRAGPPVAAGSPCRAKVVTMPRRAVLGPVLTLR